MACPEALDSCARDDSTAYVTVFARSSAVPRPEYRAVDVDVQGMDLVAQTAASDPQDPRRVRLIAPGQFEDAGQQASLHGRQNFGVQIVGLGLQSGVDESFQIAGDAASCRVVSPAAETLFESPRAKTPESSTGSSFATMRDGRRFAFRARFRARDTRSAT